MKRALVVVGAVMALGAHAQNYPEQPPGAAEGYGRFTTDLGVFCSASRPFTGTGEPVWECSKPGTVDQGIVVGPHK